MTARLAVAAALVASACTPGTAPAPTPEPTTTVPPVTTATAPSVEAPSGRAAAPPSPSAPVPAAPKGTGGAATTGDVFDALAACESGRRNLRNPPYSGYFQFVARTWRSLGLAGEAADHPYDVQRAAAEALVARSGWGQFPACGRRLGMA